jgi:serine phosphatase RsbU (regulator of sigma subunit)
MKRFSYPLSNIPLFRYGDEWIYTEKEKQIRGRDLSLLKLFDDIVSITAEKDHIWVVDEQNHLFNIDRNKSSRLAPETYLLIKNIQNESGTSYSLSDIVFNRGNNEITFSIVAPAYLKENLTQYQYFINKVMTDWSPWSTRTSYNKLVPKSGNYILSIRAKDLWGNIGDPVSLEFTVKAPFTETPVFYLTSIFTALLIIFLIVRFRERQLHEKNIILEEKVRERTAEIEAQKEEITSSIEYASRIQMAMLPMTDLFMEYFPEFFIIFKPRDIVSGDFYWIGEDEKDIFFTVADCTGHGVPGAFMSTLGISVLNEIITHNTDLQANTVLNLLREKIKTSLHQTGKEGEAADGMDISLCVFRKDRKSIQFSGAYNPLFIVNGGELKEYKADRMPIGIHYGKEPSFTNYEINVKKGDAIYILSDGYVDQFGGHDYSKYKKANLKKLLSEIYDHPMAEQQRIIEGEFEKWKGKAEQVDDITIIGVRI